MSSEGPNPYAPPPPLDPEDRQQVDSLESLRQGGPILFRGQLSSDDLSRYLQGYDHIGCGSMFGTAVGVVFIVLTFTLLIGGAVALLLLGVLGWFGLMFLTSLPPYRRSVFISNNPRWSAPVSGEITADGISIHRADSKSSFRWDWFGDTIVGEDVIALLPALHPHQPLILTPSMVNRLDDWDRLLGVAKMLAAAIDPMSTRESRRYDNRAILRSRNRKRSMPIPDHAIAFEGMVSMADLKHLPPVMLRRNRPTRAYVLLMGLAVFASLIVIGSVRMMGIGSLPLTLLFVLILIPVASLLLVRRMRSMRSSGDTIYYLTAHADSAGITSDFGVTRSFVPWESMQLSESSDEAVVLSRPDTRQFIIARRDMFDDSDSWTRFRGLIAGQGHSGS